MSNSRAPQCSLLEGSSGYKNINKCLIVPLHSLSPNLLSCLWQRQILPQTVGTRWRFLSGALNASTSKCSSLLVVYIPRTVRSSTRQTYIDSVLQLFLLACGNLGHSTTDHSRRHFYCLYYIPARWCRGSRASHSVYRNQDCLWDTPGLWRYMVYIFYKKINKLRISAKTLSIWGTSGHQHDYKLYFKQLIHLNFKLSGIIRWVMSDRIDRLALVRRQLHKLLLSLY